MKRRALWHHLLHCMYCDTGTASVRDCNQTQLVGLGVHVRMEIEDRTGQLYMLPSWTKSFDESINIQYNSAWRPPQS